MPAQPLRRNAVSILKDVAAQSGTLDSPQAAALVAEFKRYCRLNAENLREAVDELVARLRHPSTRNAYRLSAVHLLDVIVLRSAAARAHAFSESVLRGIARRQVLVSPQDNTLASAAAAAAPRHPQARAARSTTVHSIFRRARRATPLRATSAVKEKFLAALFAWNAKFGNIYPVLGQTITFVERELAINVTRYREQQSEFTRQTDALRNSILKDLDDYSHDITTACEELSGCVDLLSYDSLFSDNQAAALPTGLRTRLRDTISASGLGSSGYRIVVDLRAGLADAARQREGHAGIDHEVLDCARRTYTEIAIRYAPLLELLVHRVARLRRARGVCVTRAIDARVSALRERVSAASARATGAGIDVMSCLNDSELRNISAPSAEFDDADLAPTGCINTDSELSDGDFEEVLIV